MADDDGVSSLNVGEIKGVIYEAIAKLRPTAAEADFNESDIEEVAAVASQLGGKIRSVDAFVKLISRSNCIAGRKCAWQS